MDIGSGLLEVAVVMPFILLGGGLVAYAWSRQARPAPGALTVAPGDHHEHHLAATLGLIGMWLVLTALAWWCEWVVLFVALNAVLFSLGTVAASIGLIVSVLVLEATPIVLAIVLVRRTRHIELPASPERRA